MVKKKLKCDLNQSLYTNHFRFRNYSYISQSKYVLSKQYNTIQETPKENYQNPTTIQTRVRVKTIIKYRQLSLSFERDFTVEIGISLQPFSAFSR